MNKIPKYNSLEEWKKNEPKAYSAAYRLKLVYKICDKFNWELPKKNKTWTLDLCKKNALKYKSRTEWSKKNGGAYSFAKKNGWIEECCQHMELILKPKGYWTLELCKKDALIYNSRTEWQKYSRSAYKFARENKYISECCTHMNGKEKKPNGYWTLDLCKQSALKFKTRSEWQSNSNSSYQSAKKNNWIEECCKHMDLNFDLCIKDSCKYITRSEWKKKSGYIYRFAKKNNWLEECCKNMSQIIKQKGYWTLDLCKQNALQYNTRNEWGRNNGGAYAVARKNNWLEECCKHMEQIVKPNGYWTFERCQRDALSYKSRSEWGKNNNGAYTVARKNNWLEECCKHMKIVRPNGYWTFELCKQNALQYNTRNEWGKNSGAAYGVARKNNWLEECCKHMEQVVKPNGYWTLDLCKQNALQYNTRSEWGKNNGGAYAVARKNNWLEECCKHMEQIVKPNGYWTFERCQKDALNYNTRSEWANNSSGYQIAKRKKWLDIFYKS